jgi:protein-S-isoprenylcysteine O-methyltransferase Ste14
LSPDALVLKAAGLLAATICYLAFILGIRTVFDPRGERPRRRVALSFLVFFSVPAFLLAMAVSDRVYPVNALLGLGLYVGSLALFTWAGRVSRRAGRFTHAFCEDVPVVLVSEGPYRWVRHPLYASYILSGVAGSVFSLQPLTLPLLALVVWMYWDAARMEERKFEKSELRDAYGEYRRKAGMFLPRFV